MMKWFINKLRRINGISTPLGGISWDSSSDDLDLKRERRAAAYKFQSAFAEAITQITQDRIDPYYLMHNSKIQHDTAIFEFRYVIDSDQRHDFDVATETFQQARAALEPALLQYYKNEVQRNQKNDQSQNKRLLEAIHCLLDFTEKS